MRKHTPSHLLWLVFITLVCLALETAQKVSSFSITSTSHHASTRRLTTTSTSFLSSKWDSLVDDDEEEEYIPPDMRYIPRNVMRQNQHFVDIRNAGGKQVTNDVYARDPKSSTFWFVGKVARVSGVSLEECIAKQWSLIETHACNLRPIELFPSRGEIEIWTAPGDSELDVAYNRPNIVFQKMKKDVDGAAAKIKNTLVGYQGEMYEPGEDGFRAQRLEDGRPARPEIKGPQEEEEEGETRAPTEQEIEQLQKALEEKNMTLEDLYEQQERQKEEADADE